MMAGYMFRNVPDDNVEGVAMAYYLRRKVDPAIGSIAVLYGDSAYAGGVKDCVQEDVRGAWEELTISRQVIFRENVEDAAGRQRRGSMYWPSNRRRRRSSLIASDQDALKLVNAWYNQGKPCHPNLRWFMSNGARRPSFLVGAPVGVRGMCGTAPTYQSEGAPTWL